MLRHKHSKHSSKDRHEDSEVSDSSETDESVMDSESAEETEETIDPWYDIVKYSFDENQDEMKTLTEDIMESDNGINEEAARKKAYRELLPTLRKAVIKKYLFRIIWFETMKTDPMHRAVRKTVRRLRDEEDYESEEAWKAAVNRRKYLFDKLLAKYSPGSNAAREF